MRDVIEEVMELKGRCLARPPITNEAEWTEVMAYMEKYNFSGIPGAMATGMFSWYAPGLLQVIAWTEG